MWYGKRDSNLIGELRALCVTIAGPCVVSLTPKLIHGRVAPTPARWREQRCARRHSVFPVFAIALAALLLAAVAAPEAHAQTDDDRGGAVQVSNVQNPMTSGTSLRLNIKQGSSGSYYFRLSEAPAEDGWYVRIFVEEVHWQDGACPPGDTAGTSWIPSIGRDVDMDVCGVSGP